jgi:metal-responsive CopG/Arc/MetJ family transcriptional regulator
LRKEYTTVKIPVELSEKLDKVARDLGYRSRAEIVNDAIRRFLVTKDVEELRSFNAPVAPAIVREITQVKKVK